MDREPKDAPFPVGAKIRYLGDRRSWTVAPDGTKTPTIFPGIEVVVLRTKPGFRGTLRHLRDEDGLMFYEDTGEPILDKTRDGYSVYEAGGMGRCIDADAAGEWEIV